VDERAQRARAFAVDAHGDQKYGEEPYAVHLDEVAAILVGIGSDLIAEAYLHDVVENTKVVKDELTAPFGERTTAIVDACTGEGKNRRERCASIVAKLLRLPEAIPVKLADRLANMLRSLTDRAKGKMYAGEYENFRKNLHPLSANCPLWADLDEVYAKLQSIGC
jgi:(p)ppGpp synthase/HD superfamily hydrolase